MVKFNNGKSLDQYSIELHNKYKYPIYLAEDIALTAETIVDYLGVEYEQAILTAIDNTKVVLVEGKHKDGVKKTITDILERENVNINVEGVSPLKESDVRNIETMYTERPEIIHDENGYTIKNVQRLAIINREYSDSTYFKADLADVLMRSVKSQLGAYSIDGNTMTIKNGLTVRTEKLSLENGEVKRTFVGEIGYGLERGICNYENMGVGREAYQNDYDPAKIRPYSFPAAAVILDKLKLKQIIRIAEITKDPTELSQMIGEHASVEYEDFLRIFDGLWEKEEEYLASFSKDDETHQNKEQEIEAYYRKTIAPLTAAMRVSMQIPYDQETDMNHSIAL